MLKTDCCDNYICAYCAEDVNKYIKLQKIEIPTCHFCKKENFTVSDVPLGEKVRQYTDSPFSSTSQTLTSSFAKNFNATPGSRSGVKLDANALSATPKANTRSGVADGSKESNGDQRELSNGLKVAGLRSNRDICDQEGEENVPDGDDENANACRRRLFSALDGYQVTPLGQPQQQIDEEDEDEEEKLSHQENSRISTKGISNQGTSGNYSSLPMYLAVTS